VLEPRDLAIPGPPANLTSANQRRWLAVQQSQVNQDALRTVLLGARDILVGSPLLGAVAAFVAINTFEKAGVLGGTEGNILKGLVVTGPFVQAIGQVGAAVGSVAGAVGSLRGLVP